MTAVSPDEMTTRDHARVVAPPLEPLIEWNAASGASPLSLASASRPPAATIRARLAAVMVGALLIGAPAQAAIFVVDNIGDLVDTSPGDGICRALGNICTLRAAIEEANALAGNDTIHFNIAPAGAHTITPGSPLPTITSRIVIDGTTQPGFGGSPIIRLNGVSAGGGVNGLTLNLAGSSGSTIRGLMITQFTADGIRVQSAAANITIAGNWIGTTGTGSTGVGNGDEGIELLGSAAVIGGLGANDGNVITNSRDEGINIIGTGATAHVIQGNFIGVDPDGSSGNGNGDVGIAIISGTGNIIGGATAAARNVISRNVEGMEINTDDNVVQGNYIGVDVTGTINRGNRSDDGVEIQGGGSGNTIGGASTGMGNVIAFNARDGVNLVSGSGNSVLGNSIHSNSGLGIDLAPNGVNANDGVKTAGQPNLWVDFPVFTSAIQTGTLLTVAGYVGNAPNQPIFANARVEIFKADNDPSGYGEGQTYLGFLTSDASGNFSGTVDITGKGLALGDQITGTATDAANNTSEFGANFVPAVTMSYSVGTDNTALYSDTAFASAGVLTLNSPAANKIGVGDEVREGANRYYIVERNSATEFTIQNSAANGGTPGDTNLTFASTAITIFRAFNSLSAAEAGSLDANHLGTANLVAGNYQLSWPCYGDGPDTTPVVINGWTTGPDNYIKLYTPRNPNEVGTSQRHDGAWDTAAYRLEAGGGSVLEVREEYVRVDGLQVRLTTDTVNVAGIGITGATGVSRYDVSNNIIRGNGVGTQNIRLGLNLYLAGSGVLNAWNNIIYDFAGGSSLVVGLAPDDAEFTNYLYNNTVVDCADGIRNLAGTVIAKNNIAYNNADNWRGTFDAASTNNLSGPAADAQIPATNARDGVSVTFANVAGDDFHLASGDTGAQDFGANLSTDPSLAFAVDIDHSGRRTPWDIGADDVLATTAVDLVSFAAQSGDGTTELFWETGSELDNLGFHLYRALDALGPYVRITSTLIPGLGSSPAGASYTYRDAGLTNGVTYYYKLEDIETTGTTELHGPVSATPQKGASAVEADPNESDPSVSSRITYGKPWENEVRVRRGRGGLVLELITEGFYAYPHEDGSVRLEVPGLELVAEPGEPAVPVYRGRFEAFVGRKVAVSKARAKNVDVFTSLRPSFAEAPDVIAASDGTVRASSKKTRRVFLGDGELYPEEPARLVNVAFQGEAKKALVELAPLRWDANGGRLLLARHLQVRVSFRGRDRSERLLANGRRRRHVEEHSGREVLAQLATQEAGLYRIRFEDVFGPGVRTKPTSKLRLSRQGEAVAFHVAPDARTFGKGSVLYFLSDGAVANPYGQRAVYELEASGSGAVMEAVRSELDGAPVSHYWKTVEREENRLYQSTYLDAEDVWQWDWLLGPMTKSFSFQVEDLAARPMASQLEVWLQGGSDFPESPDHHVRVYVNGTMVADEWWDGETAFLLTAALGAGVLHEGENVLKLEEVGDTDALHSMILLDRFEVTHPAELVIKGGRLEGSFDQSGAVRVSGADSAHLLDVTGEQPQWITRAHRPSGVEFGVVAGHEYLVVTPDDVLAPEIRKPLRTKLRGEANAAEYLVIGPRVFLDAAEPLLAHRGREGLRTKAVAIEDIYSEFGFGEETPESVRELVSYAYHHWSEPSLRYVLLLGDATYDPKDYLETGVENQVPAKQVRTRYLWTASDPWFGAVHGEDILPDVAIGRLPAASVDEVETLVHKIVAYETGVADPGAPIVLIADDPDVAGDFAANADDLAAAVLSGRAVQKIYLSELGTAPTRSAIVDAFDGGASMMSYIGHGAIRLWASENVFNIGSVESLSLQSQQPLLFTMNCLNGYFHFPYYDSLSERLLKADGKGIIAAFSPTGLSLDAPAHRFHQALMDEVVNRAHERLGDAILAGQAAYADTGVFPELLSIYHLLGDPALRLR